MTGKHWNDEELIAHLYEVGLQDGHLSECAACRQRWESLLQSRQQLLSLEPKAPLELLAAQRRAVQARLDRRPLPLYFRFAPSLAGALLLLIAVLLLKTPPQPSPATVSDSLAFEKAFSQAYQSEPQALEPLRSLFVEVRQ